MTEHEKRAREIVYKAIPDETLFGLQDAIIRALKEAHAEGRREAKSEMKLKETVAFACGYDSGREDLLAEVVPVLEKISTFEEWCGKPNCTCRQDMAHALLEKLKND